MERNVEIIQVSKKNEKNRPHARWTVWQIISAEMPCQKVTQQVGHMMCWKTPNSVLNLGRQGPSDESWKFP